MVNITKSPIDVLYAQRHLLPRICATFIFVNCLIRDSVSQSAPEILISSGTVFYPYCIGTVSVYVGGEGGTQVPPCLTGVYLFICYFKLWVGRENAIFHISYLPQPILRHFPNREKNCGEGRKPSARRSFPTAFGGGSVGNTIGGRKFGHFLLISYQTMIGARWNFWNPLLFRAISTTHHQHCKKGAVSLRWENKKTNKTITTYSPKVNPP